MIFYSIVIYLFLRLFGGGIKKLLRTASVGGASVQQQNSQGTPTTEEARGPAVWLNKQRVRLNCKLLGHSTSIMKEDKPTYREQFIPPEMSMLAYLLTKVMQQQILIVVWQIFFFLCSQMLALIVMKYLVILKVKQKMCLIQHLLQQ